MVSGIDQLYSEIENAVIHGYDKEINTYTTLTAHDYIVELLNIKLLYGLLKDHNANIRFRVRVYGNDVVISNVKVTHYERFETLDQLYNEIHKAMTNSEDMILKEGININVPFLKYSEFRRKINELKEKYPYIEIFIENKLKGDKVIIESVTVYHLTGRILNLLTQLYFRVFNHHGQYGMGN